MGTTGTTPAGFFVEATRPGNDPLDVSVTLPASALLTLSGTFLPSPTDQFYVQAVPTAGATLLDATYSIDLDNQTYVNGTQLAANPVLNGMADLKFGLTLSFAKPDPSSSEPNPDLTSDFELCWPLNNSMTNIDTTLSQLGSNPTLSLTDVSIDLKPILDATAENLLNALLAKISPLVTLANYFSMPIPALQSLGKQIDGVLSGVTDSSANNGSNYEDPISTIVNFFKDPSLDTLISTGAQIAQTIDTDPDDSGLYEYAQEIVSAFEGISYLSNLASELKTLESQPPSFSSVTLGGSAGTDLRPPTVDLASLLTPAAEQLANPVDLSLPTNPLDLTLDDDFKVQLHIPVLEDPQEVLQLLLGDKTVHLAELDLSDNIANSAEITLFNMEFVIGVVPFNFRVQFSLPSIQFNLNMGLDSSRPGHTRSLAGTLRQLGLKPARPFG